MEKYTQNGLPVINPFTISTSIRDDKKYLEYNIDSVYAEIREILKSENPFLLIWLETWRMATPSELEKNAFTLGFAEVYKILRRQSEINKLEKSF